MKLIAITNRRLCTGNFMERFEWLAKHRPDRMILREKDLSEDDYMLLAQKCGAICRRENVPFSINSFWMIAERLSVSDIHVSIPILKDNIGLPQRFATVGVSVHSVDEAIFAEQNGASYLIAGHIFATDCKKGVPPRGLEFLQSVCQSVAIPVYAIGGITPDRLTAVEACGASGVCVMSALWCEPSRHGSIEGICSGLKA